MTMLSDFINHPRVYKNTHKAALMEKAILQNDGSLGPNGELIVRTGSHTGRSANDKYVVMSELTKDKIWWENNIHQMDHTTFKKLTDDVVSYLNSKDEVFYTERSIGSIDHFALGIEFISTHASSALFTEYMFKPGLADKKSTSFRIINAPDFKIDPKTYGVRSDTVIVTCFKERTTLIIGTHYAGEIKKSMFSVMNFLAPDHGILPMHSGANQNSKEESFVFFGLSGTGKTTLSTDVGLALIGDDEHGLSESGVFNFEGGCYAKTNKLSAETEPAIHSAATRFSSFLENVKLSDDHSKIDFFDDSITENGRASYPLEFIENRVESGVGKIPKNIFYLSADAFGVLPPVSLLTEEQAMDYFVLGYSAKLAGTEIGIKTPEATFSACFGAPFMLRYPKVYSQLLKEMISKHQIKVWLINTGWYGGSYGVGKRFPLSTTRSIIRSIQDHQLDTANFTLDPIFNLSIPTEVPNIDPSILIPKNAWSDTGAYNKVAEQLADRFAEQLKKLKH